MNSIDISALRKHDEAAFGLLVTAYERPLGRYLRSLTGHDELAKDLLQDTFLRAFTHLAGLQHDTALRPWLYRIATNLAFTAMKRRNRFRWLPWVEANAPAYTFEDELAERDRVRRALAKLPPEQSSCLLLSRIEGLKSHEVAAVLGLTPEAVRKRISRAQEFLRAQLGEEAEDADAVRSGKGPANPAPVGRA